MITRRIPRLTLCLAAASLAALIATASAQTPMADMSSMAPVPAPDTLPRPLQMTGIGNSALTITTNSPEAQMWFNQGLNELHDFWDYESARSFEQAVRVDPQCAMCYWGLSEALAFRDGKDAYSIAALDRAKKLKHNATKPEQLFIDAAVDDQNNKQKKSEDALRKIIALQPDNIQAKLLLAGELRDGYTDAGEPKPGTAQAIALYAEILKAHPDDSATNHYWIHAMEPSAHPERAIDSAQKLASLAPSSGHMVHMPGHIFYRTGDYADAEKWFARSMAVDENYMQTQHVSPDNDWNYVHNLMYAIANFMEEGKWTEAEALSSKLANARGKYEATMYVHSPRDSMTRLSRDLPVALRRADWPAVLSMLAAAQPDAKLPNLQFLAGQLRTYAQGMLDVRSGNLTAAQSASKQLDDQLAAAKAAGPDSKPKKYKKPTLPVLQPVSPDATMGPLIANLSIMAEQLRGSILVAQKNFVAAKPLFDHAAKAEKDLGYREPPAFICPVRETEGDELLRAGDAKDAHAAFAQALLERPNAGLSLYGEAESSEAAGDSAHALDEYAKFLAAWINSDPGQPEVAHARAYVASHAISADVVVPGHKPARA